MVWQSYFCTSPRIVALMGILFEVGAALLLLGVSVWHDRVLTVLFGARVVSTSSPEKIQFIRIVAGLVFLGMLVSVGGELRKLFLR
jgi:hypothetical protein